MRGPLLQFRGLPGGVELLIIGIIGLVFALIPAFLVYRDAMQRGNDEASLCSVAMLLDGLVGNSVGALFVVVLYLIAGRA